MANYKYTLDKEIGSEFKEAVTVAETVSADDTALGSNIAHLIIDEDTFTSKEQVLLAIDAIKAKILEENFPH